ncbi:MAG: cytochrome c3 family protein, partial [Mangrovicoccus sp.]
KAWFHLYPEQELAPDDGLHWTGPYKNWNARCADCHATGYEKTYDPGAKSYASRQAEMGVGCEACHGPGARHLDWAEAGAEEGRGQIPDGYGFSQSFRATAATIQHCARCHARRDAFDDASPLPGTSFHDAYGLALLEPGLYQADGQIQDEVYVYGSFLQSKMYAAGVGCLDCHDAHSAQLLAEGNGLCSQCHSLAGNARFPQLRLAEYDAPGHHFHEPGSPGGQCIACHAPERVYMGNDWRADHSFRVPRPDLARETGATDACTSCHREQSPDWAAAEIAKRYPEAIHRGAHYGQILAAGRANPAAAADDLAGLALAEGEAAIIRASALWLLKQSERPDLAALVAPLLQDRDPLLRAAAVEAQRRAAPYDRLQRLVPLLEDPSRNIRLAVAEALLDVPMTRLSPQLQSQLSSAIWEWRAAMASRLDFPETHLQMGGLALSMRSWPQAEAAFREAVHFGDEPEAALVP